MKLTEYMNLIEDSGIINTKDILVLTNFVAMNGISKNEAVKRVCDALFDLGEEDNIWVDYHSWFQGGKVVAIVFPIRLLKNKEVEKHLEAIYRLHGEGAYFNNRHIDDSFQKFDIKDVKLSSTSSFYRHIPRLGSA